MFLLFLIFTSYAQDTIHFGFYQNKIVKIDLSTNEVFDVAFFEPDENYYEILFDKENTILLLDFFDEKKYQRKVFTIYSDGYVDIENLSCDNSYFLDLDEVRSIIIRREKFKK